MDLIWPVTASVGGLVHWPPDPYYTVTKHAVVGWVRAIADARAMDGVTINAICPSVVATAMTGRPDGDDAGGRMLSPSQVARQQWTPLSAEGRVG
jgi:NAD(P)-dependent dehydrogenase (short-subunit alcohol dehydrogenase family)